MDLSVCVFVCVKFYSLCYKPSRVRVFGGVEETCTGIGFKD